MSCYQWMAHHQGYHREHTLLQQAFNQVTLSSRVSAMSCWLVCLLHTLTLKAIHYLEFVSGTNPKKRHVNVVSLNIGGRGMRRKPIYSGWTFL